MVHNSKLIIIFVITLLICEFFNKKITTISIDRSYITFGSLYNYFGIAYMSSYYSST